MITLSHGEKKLELPALEPSESFLYAYQCCELIVNLINRGDLQPTKESAQAWMKQHPDNVVKFNAAQKFMNGYPIQEYKKAFQDAYIEGLNETPEGRASVVIVKEHVGRGWVLDGLHPDLIVALAK